MKIIFKNFNTASLISKTLASLEREIIQVIINFDSTLYKNDFFFNHIDIFETIVQVLMSLFITDKTSYTPFFTRSCDKTIIT
jgi:hypothetical protein